MNARLVLAVLLGLGVAAGLSGCPDASAPPPSVGHDPNRAGEPDVPAPVPSHVQRSIRFTIDSKMPVVVTFNAGYGNRFLDAITGHDSWTEGSYSGARVYLGATPALADRRGSVTVKIDYGTDNDLICFDTNYDNTRAGADCHGKVK